MNEGLYVSRLMGSLRWDATMSSVCILTRHIVETWKREDGVSNGKFCFFLECMEDNC